MSFNENQHNRAADGKFTEKTGTEPDDYFGVQLAETLRTIRERDQREAEADAPAGPRIVRDQFGNFPPGVTLDDLIIDEDDDEEFDASRKFSSLRSYPGMNGFPMTAPEAGEEPPLFVTDDGYEVRSADDQDAYAVYDESGTYITTVTSVSDDHLSIEDEVRERLAELEAADGR